MIRKTFSIKEIKAAMANKANAPIAPAAPTDIKKTLLTVPFYTPSDDVDIDNLTPEKKKQLIQKGKLMGTGAPITTVNIRTRGEALTGLKSGKPGHASGGWWSPNDFTYDAGTCYKAWTYTWAYLALTILSYVFIHPLIAIPFAWKVGHNWSQYIGGLVFGKEDMKGKTMYHTV